LDFADTTLPCRKTFGFTSESGIWESIWNYLNPIEAPDAYDKVLAAIIQPLFFHAGKVKPPPRKIDDFTF
jgi:hypothetical protein